VPTGPLLPGSLRDGDALPRGHLQVGAPCPLGSFNKVTGQASCAVCGRGATSSEDRLSCTCLGAFRTWRESTRSCVCSTGFLEPNITQASQTSTENSDCVPQLDPQCASGFHRDDESNKCVPDSVCAADSRCDGTGALNGRYDAQLGRCVCANAASSPTDFCDAACQAASLRAYVTSAGKILL